MISLDNSTTSKTEVKSSSSLLSTSKDEGKSTLSFSELLKGIKLKGESKDIEDGVLILNTEDDKLSNKKDEKSLSKNDALLSLLKNDDKDLKVKDLLKSESLELNPKIIESISDKLTIKEVKSLIIEAKQYLKSKIMNTDAFKKSEIKELPKTLKGLVTVAKKLGVDISKITIEEVKAQSIKPKQNLNVLDKDIKEIVSKNTKEIVSKDIKVPTKVEIKSTNNTRISNTNNQIIEKSTEKNIELPKEILKQPIFQEKFVNKKEFSTAELIQAREVKEFKVESKKPKNKADETLRMLLSGAKVEKKEVSLNPDISIASAKVIAPEMKNETIKGLESLLHSEPSESNSKAEQLLTTHKAGSLEVKLNEAKQMVKYLSQDVKQAIDDYKSPFTRIKVQLNPQKLGEVDLTVIQRGKNLVVNLSSNNTAINTLAMNVNDLRVQLSNNGINNATLNFSNNAQSEQQNSQGQQNNQNEQRQAQKEYNYFDNEEQNEEVLNSLEIVVPSYA